MRVPQPSSTSTTTAYRSDRNSFMLVIRENYGIISLILMDIAGCWTLDFFVYFSLNNSRLMDLPTGLQGTHFLYLALLPLLDLLALR